MKSPGLISQAVEFWKGDSGWNEMVGSDGTRQVGGEAVAEVREKEDRG